MLLVGDEESANTACYWVIGVNDLDPKPLERAMGEVLTPEEFEIGAFPGIQSHGVVEVEKPPAPFDERDHRALLLGRHPDELRAIIRPRPL